MEAITHRTKQLHLPAIFLQGDHSPDTLKFPDISLTTCGTNVHVKEYQELTPLSRIFSHIAHTGVPYFQMGQ